MQRQSHLCRFELRLELHAELEIQKLNPVSEKQSLSIDKKLQKCRKEIQDILNDLHKTKLTSLLAERISRLVDKVKVQCACAVKCESEQEIVEDPHDVAPIEPITSSEASGSGCCMKICMRGENKGVRCKKKEGHNPPCKFKAFRVHQ